MLNIFLKENTKCNLNLFLKEFAISYGQKKYKLMRNIIFIACVIQIISLLVVKTFVTSWIYAPGPNTQYYRFCNVHKMTKCDLELRLKLL